MNADVERMIAKIDLMDNKKVYIVKDRQLVEHDLPDYGETLIITIGGKVDRLETKTKRKV